MEDDDHATHAAPRSSKTGVRDSLGSTIVPPPPSDSASDRSSYDDDLDEDLSAVDGDEERTMEDEDPDPAFETIERGPLADFDDDELRGILARAAGAEDDDDISSTTTTSTTGQRRGGSRGGLGETEPMSPPRRSPRSSPRPRTARALPPPPTFLDAATKKKSRPTTPARSSGPTRGQGVVADLATSQPPAAVEHRELAPALDKLEPDLESTADGTRKPRGASARH